MDQLKTHVLGENPNQIILLNTSLEKAHEANISVLKTLTAAGLQGIYLSLVDDYLKLAGIFEAHGINLSDIKFIDGISRLYGNKEFEGGNVTYVSGPLALEQILSAVGNLAQSISGSKFFLILDCLNCLLLYHNVDKITDFVRSINQIIRDSTPGGVLIIYNKDKTLQTLSDRLADVTKIIEIRG